VSTDEDTDPIVRRHLRAGWWSLLAWLALGIVLEALHATKAALYLDVGNETRRLLFRLAHAHGTLLGLINVAYALTARAVPATRSPLASGCLLAALLLLPAGFLLGGVWARGGDPGIGVVLVPAGAAALVLGIGAVARRVG
jgi:hypothetical protein